MYAVAPARKFTELNRLFLPEYERNFNDVYLSASENRYIRNRLSRYDSNRIANCAKNCAR